MLVGVKGYTLFRRSPCVYAFDDRFRAKTELTWTGYADERKVGRH